MDNIIDNYDLFIFDLDNTIIETEKYHYNAWLETIRNNINVNFNISFEYFCEKFHSKDPESIQKYLENQLNLNNYNDLIKEKNKIYFNLINYDNKKLNLINNIEIFIELIIKNNKKFIIVTSSLENTIKFFFELFPILTKCEKYYCREMFIDKKISNEVFNKINFDYPNEKKIGFEYNITSLHSLYQTRNIKTVFVNSESYIHYNYIIKNYSDIIIIKDYNELYKYYIENKIVNTMRLLSIDMVESANSGHPGAPLGCAPTMFVLMCKIMNYNPLDPTWEFRDRFILSNGHACALLYSTLYLLGYDYGIEDLKRFRKLHSKTPGHPEFNQSLGIEVSTGPLGQGIANGVGMAIASKKLDLNNNIYVMCGDGCLMEGISYESASLAGHLKLNNLIILYDDNGITIDGKTEITFTENVRDRFRSMNWNVLEIVNGDTDINDIYNKINEAKKEQNKPSIIFIKTTIGYGSISSGTSSVHGAPLGKENTKRLKKVFGFDEDKSFNIDEDIIKYFDNIKNDKKIYYDKYNNKINNIIKINTINEEYIKKCIFEISKIENGEKNYATRDISNIFLNTIIKHNPNMIVGSADLAESNKTMISSEIINSNNFSGMYLHYGIREHAMMSIANGISTHGLIPVVSTFLVFITYSLCSIRMAALSKHKVIYILTHDSVFLGEDGPTHQPVESLTILRSIPNLLTIRPCDINETCGSYIEALKYDGPTALILSRQVLPNIENSDKKGVSKGGYIVWNEDIIEREIDYIIVASGSEVSLAIEVAKIIDELDKKNVRVVSMVCTNLFDKQSDEYKKLILPDKIKKISIEAGSTLGWYKYVDYTYGIDSFGESGNINEIKEYFGFKTQRIREFIKLL